MSAVENAVSAVVDVPKKVLAVWQRPVFWLGAIVLILILALAVLYVASLRDWAMTQLQMRAITSGVTPEASPTTADNPAQGEPIKLATQL